MSEITALQQDLRELTRAVKELTLVISRQPGGAIGGVSASSVRVEEDKVSENWDLVEDSVGIPGAPANYLTTNLEIQFEEGPGPTPQFVIDLAKRHLTSSRHCAEDRARAAFVAGFWAKAFWSCHASSHRPSTYKPGIAATHWVLRRGPGFDLIRVTSQSDADQLCKDFPDIVPVEKLPSLTELQIFCAGAKAPVPALWKWSGSR